VFKAGRYVEVRIERLRAARFGLSLADVQQVVALGICGENIGETVEGLQRFPINMRYPRELRDSVEKLMRLPIVTAEGATTMLGGVADLVVTDGPPQIRSENARLNGWVYVGISSGISAPMWLRRKFAEPSLREGSLRAQFTRAQRG
jgi:Cu(I)/Ag(I) efflux system membrane protein CusA/SilA